MKEMIEAFDLKSDDEKLKVCQTLNNFVTYNGFSKDYIIHVFKWLYSVSVEEVENE